MRGTFPERGGDDSGVLERLFGPRPPDAEKEDEGEDEGVPKKQYFWINSIGGNDGDASLSSFVSLSGEVGPRTGRRGTLAKYPPFPAVFAFAFPFPFPDGRAVGVREAFGVGVSPPPSCSCSCVGEGSGELVCSGVGVAESGGVGITCACPLGGVVVVVACVCVRGEEGAGAGGAGAGPGAFNDAPPLELANPSQVAALPCPILPIPILPIPIFIPS